MTVDVRAFSDDDLSRRCAEEASKKDAKKRNDSFCYELVRRAFGLEEEEAMRHVYYIYVHIWSTRWIRNPHQFDSHPLTAADFIHIAFNKVRLEIKGRPFANFPLLNPFLAYLHTTLVRVVAEYLRKRKGREEINSSDTDEDKLDPRDNIPSADDPSDEVENRDLKQKIRERIKFLLPEEKDWTLYECWSNQMSRADIVAAFPNWWPTEDSVRKDVQRIVHRKLGSDPILRDLLDQLRGKK